jgi:hypothetical protein
MQVFVIKKKWVTHKPPIFRPNKNHRVGLSHLTQTAFTTVQHKGTITFLFMQVIRKIKLIGCIAAINKRQ